jgi:ADP-ribosylglycohydrolase
MSATHQNRAIGAIMGAFVGEALGVGPTGITT